MGLAQLATAWTLAFADPDVMRERLAPLATFAPLTALLMAGLADRLRWAPAFAPGATGVRVELFAAGAVLGLWALASNLFYTPLVRIRPATVTQSPAVVPSGQCATRGPSASSSPTSRAPLILGSP